MAKTVEVSHGVSNVWLVFLVNRVAVACHRQDLRLPHGLAVVNLRGLGVDPWDLAS